MSRRHSGGARLTRLPRAAWLQVQQVRCQGGRPGASHGNRHFAADDDELLVPARTVLDDDDDELLVTAHTVLDSQRPQMDRTVDRGLSSGVGREGAKEMGGE